LLTENHNSKYIYQRCDKMVKETDKRLICFLHIEKAAGTTVHEILRNNFWNYFWESPYIYYPGDEAQKFHLQSKELFLIGKKILGFRAFGGHGIRIFEDYGKAFNNDVFYFTFLRDPIKRYLSNYFFQKYNMELDRSFEEYLADDYFSNFMTKKIGGKSDYDLAVEIINKYNVFVGIVEMFDVSLIRLKQKLDLNNKFWINYEKRNVNQSKYGYAEVLQKLIQKYEGKIYENNQIDIKLYDHFLIKFQNEIKKECDIHEKLKHFQETNSNYKFSKLRIKLLHRLKRLYFQKLELIYRDTSKRKLSI